MPGGGFLREGSAPFCSKGEGRVKESPGELADDALNYTHGQWFSRRKGEVVRADEWKMLRNRGREK